MIYLDNHTCTRPSEKVSQPPSWMAHDAPYFSDEKTFAQIENSYQILRNFVGASLDDHCIITSSGAEGISQIYHSAFIDHAYPTGRNHFLTPSIQGASFLVGMDRYKSLGLCVKHIPVNEKGHVTKEALERLISPRTTLLSLSWAHPLTGVIQPIWEIAEICREKGILLHIDISEVLGRLYFRFEDLAVDYITFDGKSIHGPRSSGVLFVKKGEKIGPLIASANEQGGLRGGDLSLSALFGLAQTATEMMERMDHCCLEVARLRDYFETKVAQKVQNAVVFFREVERVPHISTIAFPGVHADLLLFDLSQKEMYASLGGGEVKRLEDVLVACHIDPALACSSLSFGLSHETTMDEIDQAVEMIAESTHRLQYLSQTVRT